ncbi:MAG: hypothetical protein M9894_39020 [Planctomycetes bacterium]|nr:hypothetical protein [Planctomycetota bacterium]
MPNPPDGALVRTLDRVARRLRARGGLEAAVVGAAVAAPLGVLLSAGVWLDLLEPPAWGRRPLPPEVLILAPVALGALLGAALGLLRRVGRGTAAAVLDAGGHGAVFATALEVDPRHPFAALVRAEADRAAAGLSPRRAAPLRLPRRGARALAAGLLAAVVVLHLPPVQRDAAQQARAVAELPPERAAELERLHARMARLGDERGVAGLVRAAERLQAFSQDLVDARLTELEALARLGEVEEELRAERERIEARARLAGRLEAGAARAALQLPAGVEALGGLDPAARAEARAAFARAAEEAAALGEVQALLRDAARSLEPGLPPAEAARALDALRRALADQPAAHVDDIARAEVDRAAAELEALRGVFSRPDEAQLARAEPAAPAEPAPATTAGDERATADGRAPEPAGHGPADEAERHAGDHAPRADARESDGPGRPADPDRPSGEVAARPSDGAASTDAAPAAPTGPTPAERAARPEHADDAPAQDGRPPTGRGAPDGRPSTGPQDERPPPEVAGRPDDATPQPPGRAPLAPPERPQPGEAAARSPGAPPSPPSDLLMGLAERMGEDLLRSLDADTLAGLARMARSMLGDQAPPPAPSAEQAREALDRLQGLDPETQRKLLDVAARLREDAAGAPAGERPEGAPLDPAEVQERLAGLDPEVRARLEDLARGDDRRAGAQQGDAGGEGARGLGAGPGELAGSSGVGSGDPRARPAPGDPAAGDTRSPPIDDDDAPHVRRPGGASDGDTRSPPIDDGDDAATADTRSPPQEDDGLAAGEASRGRTIYTPDGDEPEPEARVGEPTGTAGARRRASVPFDQAVRAAEARALEALGRQRVPEAYERVVREYFDRAQREAR